jgi:hypothetical protein
MEDEALHGLS